MEIKVVELGIRRVIVRGNKAVKKRVRLVRPVCIFFMKILLCTCARARARVNIMEVSILWGKLWCNSVVSSRI